MKRIDPETTPGGLGTRPITLSIETLLPDPDSPTKANTSPVATLMSIPLTAYTVRSGRTKRTFRSLIASNSPVSVVRSDLRSKPDVGAVLVTRGDGADPPGSFEPR